MLKKKVYLLHKTVCPATERYYIGVHATRKPYLDGYQGSGDWVKSCLETNVHLITGILEFFATEAEAYAKEAALVTWEKVQHDPLMMNRISGGLGGWKGMTPEKCAERNRRIQTDAERQKRSDTLTAYYKVVPHHVTGKPKSAKQKLEMSKSQRGRTFSAESRAKMSESQKARIALSGVKPVPPALRASSAT